MPDKRTYADRKEYNRELHARRMATDPEYRERKKAYARAWANAKYASDPVYRQRAKDRAKAYAATHGHSVKKPKATGRTRQCTECGTMFKGIGRHCGVCW